MTENVLEGQPSFTFIPVKDQTTTAKPPAALDQFVHHSLLGTIVINPGIELENRFKL